MTAELQSNRDNPMSPAVEPQKWFRHVKRFLIGLGLLIVGGVGVVLLVPPPIEGIYVIIESSDGGTMWRCYRNGMIYECDSTTKQAVPVAKYSWDLSKRRWQRSSKFTDRDDFVVEPGWLGVTEHGVMGRFLFLRRSFASWSQFIVVDDHKTPDERLQDAVSELRSQGIKVRVESPKAEASVEVVPGETR